MIWKGATGQVPIVIFAFFSLDRAITKKRTQSINYSYVDNVDDLMDGRKYAKDSLFNE
jgi:hypothetical protein